jgi:hypothetical protein
VNAARNCCLVAPPDPAPLSRAEIVACSIESLAFGWPSFAASRTWVAQSLAPAPDPGEAMLAGPCTTLLVAGYGAGDLSTPRTCRRLDRHVVRGRRPRGEPHRGLALDRPGAGALIGGRALPPVVDVGPAGRSPCPASRPGVRSSHDRQLSAIRRRTQSSSPIPGHASGRAESGSPYPLLDSWLQETSRLMPWRKSVSWRGGGGRGVA